jgi:GalNAc-alpha-(1->4)-GalNAc-alpha-(1->3)-diNAcBac-PP-undecaprenol alpha-1,4-N-acetyl-D-galactosaminyltransferase
MRLLFIIDNLGSGGSQRQIVNLTLGLTRRGHVVELFIYYPQYTHFAPVLLDSGIRIHSYPKKGRYSIGPALALRRLMGTEKYTAMLAFLATPSFYAELARLGLDSIPLVVSERSTYNKRFLSLNQWVFRQFHRLADHITVNSHHQRERLQQMFPWMNGRISTIYNGVDLGVFKPESNANNRSIDTLRLLVLSSVVPNKNALGLVNALSQYINDYSGNCSVHWAGKVDDNRQAQREFHRVKQHIKELNLGDHWEWLGERRDVPKLLREHDALIHPSFYEGLPNAICEALACGLPVLASNIGDHPRLICDGKAGFLFNPHDSFNIAEVIHRFHDLTDKERLGMSEAARNFAEKELSLETYSARYETLFQSLIDRD